jgi:hypothetical protein
MNLNRENLLAALFAAAVGVALLWGLAGAQYYETHVCNDDFYWNGTGCVPEMSIQSPPCPDGSLAQGTSSTEMSINDPRQGWFCHGRKIEPAPPDIAQKWHYVHSRRGDKRNGDLLMDTNGQRPGIDTFPLEKDVPIPKAKGGAGLLKYPWLDMEIGDSFVVLDGPIGEDNARPKYRTGATNWANKAFAPRRFCCRRWGDHTTRIWRIA